ncbi:MAG: hypothetical protein RIS79_3546 [Verrucomicrobiota bacterium]|jgi:hypothetical protein
MLKANQHFILSFFGPPLLAGLACYVLYLLNFWMSLKTPALMTALLLNAVVFFLIGRWGIRTFVSVRCPYCRGRAYEIEGRGHRFMCLGCCRDH